MSAKRALLIPGNGNGRGARSVCYLLAAAGAIAASLLPGAARAQELVYCDMAEQAQWTTKLQQNLDASVVFSGERRKIGVRLTEEKASQRGTAFHKIPILFAPGDSLFSHFRLRIS